MLFRFVFVEFRYVKSAQNWLTVATPRIPMSVSLKSTIFRFIVWSKCLVLDVNHVDDEIDTVNTRKGARKQNAFRHFDGIKFIFILPLIFTFVYEDLENYTVRVRLELFEVYTVL